MPAIATYARLAAVLLIALGAAATLVDQPRHSHAQPAAAEDEGEAIVSLFIPSHSSEPGEWVRMRSGWPWDHEWTETAFLERSTPYGNDEIEPRDVLDVVDALIPDRIEASEEGDGRFLVRGRPADIELTREIARAMLDADRAPTELELRGYEIDAAAWRSWRTRPDGGELFVPTADFRAWAASTDGVREVARTTSAVRDRYPARLSATQETSHIIDWAVSVGQQATYAPIVETIATGPIAEVTPHGVLGGAATDLQVTLQWWHDHQVADRVATADVDPLPLHTIRAARLTTALRLPRGNSLLLAAEGDEAGGVVRVAEIVATPSSIMPLVEQWSSPDGSRVATRYDIRDLYAMYRNIDAPPIGWYGGHGRAGSRSWLPPQPDPQRRWDNDSLVDDLPGEIASMEPYRSAVIVGAGPEDPVFERAAEAIEMRRRSPRQQLQTRVVAMELPVDQLAEAQTTIAADGISAWLSSPAGADGAVLLDTTLGSASGQLVSAAATSHRSFIEGYMVIASIGGEQGVDPMIDDCIAGTSIAIRASQTIRRSSGSAEVHLRLDGATSAALGPGGAPLIESLSTMLGPVHFPRAGIVRYRLDRTLPYGQWTTLTASAPHRPGMLLIAACVERADSD